MERKMCCFSPLGDGLPTDMKETCAEKEDGAREKAVHMHHESHEEKQIRRNMLAIAVMKKGSIHLTVVAIV